MSEEFEDIKVDPVTGIREFVEICSDEQAAQFRKEVVIPYFKDIFKVSFANLKSLAESSKLGDSKRIDKFTFLEVRLK